MALQDPNVKEDIADGGSGDSTTTSSTGGFKFKPDSITGFYCPGVDSFDEYLTLAGISTDSDGYLNTNQFCTTYMASDDELAKRAKWCADEYSYSSGGNLYNTWNYMTYPAPGSALGYICLPFQVDGSSPYMVLPGTTPHFNTCLFEKTSGNWQIERTSTALTLKNASNGSISAQWFASSFDCGVIPLFLAVVAIGGGGGGGSSASTYSGHGGGGGGASFGIFNIAKAGSAIIYVGSAGAKGDHDSGRDNPHRGTAGGNTQLAGGDGGSFIAYGGYGGYAGNDKDYNTSVNGGGGSASTSNVLNGLYYWSITAPKSYSLITSASGGKGGIVGFNGSESSLEQLGALATVHDLGPFQHTTLQVSGFGGYGMTAEDAFGITLYGGGGGGASVLGAGGLAGQVGLKDAGDNGSTPGGGGGGGGFTAGSWYDGGSGGSGAIYIYY